MFGNDGYLGGLPNCLFMKTGCKILFHEARLMLLRLVYTESNQTVPTETVPRVKCENCHFFDKASQFFIQLPETLEST